MSVCLSACLSVSLCLHRTAPIHQQLITLVTCYTPSRHKTNWTSANVQPVAVNKFSSFPTITGGIHTDILVPFSVCQACLLTFLYWLTNVNKTPGFVSLTAVLMKLCVSRVVTFGRWKAFTDASKDRNIFIRWMKQSKCSSCARRQGL